jgi:hypothetical protein
MLSTTLCFSQDVLTKKSGDDILAKVLEETSTEVKYKKFDNQSGPTFTILKSELLMVRYENGTKDLFNETKKIEKLFNINSTKKEIKNLVYLNLNILNNPEVRQPIYDMLQNKSYVTTQYGRNGLNYDDYLYNLYNHCFMICPEGNGIDVHQPWESLYVNTIPIQRKNINNKNWRDLPICWVDEWEQIEDEGFLKSEHKRITESKYDLTKLDFDFWKNKIQNSI